MNLQIQAYTRKNFEGRYDGFMEMTLNGVRDYKQLVWNIRDESQCSTLQDMKRQWLEVENAKAA